MNVTAGRMVGGLRAGRVQARTGDRAQPIGIGLLLLGFVAVLATVTLGRSRWQAPGLRSAIETLISLMALVSAVLIGVTVRRSRRVQDFLVLASLAAVALIDFVFSALPAIGQYELAVDAMGARMAAMLFATIAFAAAALAPADRPVTRTRARLIGFVLLGGLVALAGGQALQAVVGSATATSIQAYRPAVGFTAALSSLGLLTAAGLFITRRHDAQGPLLAAAAFLLAVSAMQRVFLPVESSGWVTPSDIIRTTAYVVLLVVAIRLYNEARAGATAEALAAERARIAHDLHDGLAQDLALIAVHGERLARTLGAGHPVVAAAKRALDRSRGEIVELVSDPPPSTEIALRRLGADLARRYDLVVDVSAPEEPSPDFSPAERAELLGIAREAIFNAAHHGHAGAVLLTLGSRSSGMLLEVVDDGCGIGSSLARASTGTGLGLPMMRIRAGRLGAELRAVRCGEAGGTRVEIVVASPPR